MNTYRAVEDELQPQDLKEVDEMAASLIIESESGTWTGTQNSHNGYYAGDFSEAPWVSQSQLAALATLFQVPERAQRSRWA